MAKQSNAVVRFRLIGESRDGDFEIGTFEAEVPVVLENGSAWSEHVTAGMPAPGRDVAERRDPKRGISDKPASPQRVFNRILCFLGFHPRAALRADMTCGDCGRFVR